MRLSAQDSPCLLVGAGGVFRQALQYIRETFGGRGRLPTRHRPRQIERPLLQVGGQVKGQENLLPHAGAFSLEPLVVSSGTESDGASQPLMTAWGVQSAVFEQDPNTSAAWTYGNVNSADIGYKVP